MDTNDCVFQETLDSIVQNIFNPNKDVITLYKDAIKSIANIFFISEVSLIVNDLPTNFNETIMLYKKTEAEILNIVPIDLYYNNDYIKVTYRFYRFDNSSFSDDELKYLYNLTNAMFSAYAYKDTYKRLKEAPQIDFDTGIKNAKGFLDYGLELKKKEKNNLLKYASIYINIRQFRVINQNYGFNVGNYLITQFAHTLHNFINNEGITARVHGDSFIVLIKKENFDAFFEFIETIAITMTSTHTKETIDYTPTYYIGVYNIDEDVSMDTVLERTTIAYEHSRTNISARYIEFSQQMRNQILLSNEIESTMLESLESNEFMVFYQPKVSLTTNKMVGAEALVRWNKGGIILLPAKFIPIFEENGFVCNLDFYMLENVCRAMRDWINNGLEIVPISVNFSKLHLLDKNFIDNLCKVLNKYDIPTKYIEIELTEMTFLNSSEVSMPEIVNRLKSLGFLTSIDDFGSGYSSLNLLKDIPVDIIKLDKDFFNIEQDSEKEHIIIESIITMSKRLKMHVISEGVETLEQSEFLKKVGCDVAQGYLYSKPIPFEEFEAKMYSRDYFFTIK